MDYTLGKLTFSPAISNLSLFPLPIQKLLQEWKGKTPLDEFKVSEINPDFCSATDLCTNYDIPFKQGANCIIIEGRRGSLVHYAACLIPINARTDLNGIVRKHLNARQVSLTSKDFAVNTSQMEYGSITVVGLPCDWQILIDERLIHIPRLVIGGGLKKSKLLITGNILTELPNTTIIKNLCS